MTNEEYINQHPEQFKDDIDKWLFTEFGIIGGCCSAEKSHEYSIARMVAEKYEQNRLAACDAQTEQEANIEQDFVIEIIKKEHRQPTYNDAIKYGMKLQREQMMKEAVDGLIFAKLEDGSIMARSHYFKSGIINYLDNVKLIIVKED